MKPLFYACNLFRPLKKDVPGDIVHLIRDKGVDAVVLTLNPGRIAGFFTRSVSAKVSRNISSLAANLGVAQRYFRLHTVVRSMKETMDEIHPVWL